MNKPKKTNKIIAVDFDGTLVKHEFPNIGADVPNAFEMLQTYQKRGYKIILNTMRSGSTLNAAVKHIESRGINLYGINNNPTQKSWTDSPKVYADFYIDDAAIGCPLYYPIIGRPYVDWDKVNEIIEKRYITG